MDEVKQNMLSWGTRSFPAFIFSIIEIYWNGRRDMEPDVIRRANYVCGYHLSSCGQVLLRLPRRPISSFRWTAIRLLGVP